MTDSGLRVHTSIFYINDYHGKSINMERTITASKAFDNFHKNDNTDTLKLSSGDIMLGEDFNTNKIAATFQNIIGINASAMGNHEYDMQEKMGSILPFVKYNLLSSNIKIQKQSPLNNKVKSYITEEKNGHKYGIIGTTPVDLFVHSKQGVIQKDIKVDNVKDTINNIQKASDELQKQGVNKIILLSHLGNNADKILARHTRGIDVILGGHSHELIFDVKEGENLFYNKDGEPVIITQAGRDGKNFGILNLEFDENGIIRKVQNNIGHSKDFHRDMSAKYIFDKMFGSREIYGKIKSAPPAPNNYLIEANPHAYFITDCIKKDLDVDIALLPSANIRGFFEVGNVDTRILSDILPFKNKLYKVNYSEKEIVEGLKAGAKSFKNIANKPGIFYASGLEYTMNRNGELLSLKFIDKNGKATTIDINNPREDKFYTTILNDYCALGNDKFTMFNQPDRILEKYSFDATKCVENILKSSKEAFEIKDDGRILII
ncbi:5'-nucleotidase C-terminal domain-containing protein [bacterium]|nr:5'-nucleotidase C-terminal domain-containing protein [bacterium]